VISFSVLGVSVQVIEDPRVNFLLFYVSKLPACKIDRKLKEIPKIVKRSVRITDRKAKIPQLAEDPYLLTSSSKVSLLNVKLGCASI
jgi:hypothetical protein